MKKLLASISLALLLACAPSAFATHENTPPPSDPGTSSASTQRSIHEDHCSTTADAAVATSVAVILNLITLGIGH